MPRTLKNNQNMHPTPRSAQHTSDLMAHVLKCPGHTTDHPGHTKTPRAIRQHAKPTRRHASNQITKSFPRSSPGNRASPTTPGRANKYLKVRASLPYGYECTTIRAPLHIRIYTPPYSAERQTTTILLVTAAGSIDTHDPCWGWVGRSGEGGKTRTTSKHRNTLAAIVSYGRDAEVLRLLTVAG